MKMPQSKPLRWTGVLRLKLTSTQSLKSIDSCVRWSDSSCSADGVHAHSLHTAQQVEMVPRSFAREPQVVVLAAVLAAVLTSLPARLDGRFGSTS